MARGRMPLIINAVDFSKQANIHGYSIQYADRTGPNSGFMIDGTETVDLRSRKAVITWPLNDLHSDKLAELLTVCNDKYVAVTFFDTMLNQERSSIFIPKISAARCSMITSGGIRWFTGQTLTLRER